MKTTIQSDFALTELRPSFDPGVGTSVSCLCNGWNWGSWNAASKLVVWESGQDACWCILMYLVSSCSREDHLFLRYDLWNVTWRQQYNLTLPLLSYDQALTLVLAWVFLVFAMVGNNWGSWNAASKLVVWESGQDACWFILMYLVSSCSREDHLFLRYDLWNVTWRQQYNLTLPLLSYDQA